MKPPEVSDKEIAEAEGEMGIKKLITLGKSNMKRITLSETQCLIKKQYGI